MKAEYVDHMGDDLRVVNAARVSFGKESQYNCIGITQQGPHLSIKYKDAQLIKYLAIHGHWTPFSHCIITMREKVPIFVARQRFKHMVGFTYNEVSRRYVSDEPEFFEPKEWRGAPTAGAKQGSSEILQTINFETSDGIDEQPYTVDMENWFQQYHIEAKQLYEYLLKAEVAPEQARMVLPQSMYTEYYVTGSLYAWARAYNLRIDKHAQKEIQDLAKMWDDIIKPLFPVSWKALTCSG